MNQTTEVATDRDEGGLPQHAAGGQHPDADVMRLELRSVIASADFARAPIMKRLLAFLVEETAAGRGDQLKAYSVAVDGLGRAPDYDARADSYPRVQVGRLRRMLDNHYASARPAAGLRLTIPSGRYRIALQPAVETAEPPETPVPSDMRPIRPWQFGGHIALLLGLILLGTMLLLQVIPIRTFAANAGRERPILQVGGTAMAGESPLGNQIRATLINGLGRSDIYDLRQFPLSGKPVAGSYQLATDLVGGARPRLFLRLSTASPDRLIWSGDVSLSDLDGRDGEALDRTLAPIIATIGRVNGLIATHELQRHAGIEATGYSCLLMYHRYRKERMPAELPSIQSCVERSLRLAPENAEMQAAAAQLSIERMVSSETSPRDRAPLLLTARRHAQIATSIDPFEAWGNVARARVAIARGACPLAVNFAVRAANIQPYDPALLADVGVYLLDCDDARAESYLRRAIELGDDPDGRFYAPLLLLAIARDDHAMAREALTNMAPPVVGHNGRFHLINAAGYAMIGDTDRARAAWSQLRAGYPSIAEDPQGYFERLGYAADLRARAIGHLRRIRLLRG